MNRNPVLSKTLTIGLLALILLIPLSMIENKIGDRRNLQTQVQQDIARSAAGPQTLSGPYLILNYKLREHRTTTDPGGQTRTVTTESGPFNRVLNPQSLKIDGNADVERRSRGIYEARLFNLRSTVAGEFVVPRGYGIGKPLEDIIPLSASLVMKVSDSRGIHNRAVLTMNGSRLDFAPGVAHPFAGNGMHVPLDAPSLNDSQRYSFNFGLDLQGMSTLALTPTGNDTEMSIKSTWPHPSFGGGYLPYQRNVDEHGFSAQWRVSNLARNNAAPGEAGANPSQESISVDFIDPVNIYLLSERAVKYGVMFVVLVFTAFFMFEVLRGLRIHPMQYLLVGLAMAMFFLLIISLSEHMPFLAAYALSGSACVLLIGAYLAGVLKNHRPAWAFSGGIALLYGLLYGVLQSEDNALLMGTLILFSALAAVMLLTRRMNWYGLNEEKS